MRLRDLFGGRPEPVETTGAPETFDREHRELFRDAADLIAAGDEAISRALSGDSEKFLNASRQQGGQ
jgi:hypothetical protein